MDVWGELTMDELRCERRGSRRDLERALMRSRGERGAIEDAAVPMLRERVMRKDPPPWTPVAAPSA